ncbi:MAG: DUF5916 domain-containing protein [Chitinophagia bacterium]|jgi:Domain of unknown function (DUF5916)/Carbohydrate family 9 binding domain-like
MGRLRFFICLFLLTNQVLVAQKVTEFQQKFQTSIRPTTSIIKIDGILDEAVWATSQVAKDFHKKYPSDIGPAKQQTEARYTYDDKNLYFAFKVYDSGAYVTTSLKRDNGHDGNDGIGVILDPLNLKSNGFYFVVNALNVQSEDQLTNSMEKGPEWSWDTKWFSATKNYGTYWIAEIMIPFKSIRYDPSQKNWGINFLRVDAKNNEYSAWTKVPVNFRSYDIGYTGILNWEGEIPKLTNNIIIQPYTTGEANEDVENNKSLNASGNAGFDAKLTLNSALNLDLTVNPDFSQVEVDKQVSNLTRFDIFLPEKRNFFMENSDLFSNFGIPPIRPFYSRTIGLDKNGNKIPILFGARLSGNLSPGTRIGLMNMQTGRQGNYSPENFSAFTLQKSVLKRSVIKSYFLNRENYISAAEEKANPLDRYGRNAGVSFEYSNPQGTVSSWTNYNLAMKPGINDLNAYYEAGIGYDTRTLGMVLDFSNVGKNYYTDMGYVQRINNYDAVRDTVIRVGFKHIFTELSYKIMPTKGLIGKIEFNLQNYAAFNPDNTLNEDQLGFTFKTDFKNTSFFKTQLSNDAINLLYPISFTNGTPLPAAQYQFTNLSFSYMSDMRKLFSWFTELTFGQFYNGNIQSYSSGITLRRRPNLNVSIRGEFNKIDLPYPYGSANLFLISPRIEYNFSTQLFWTTFLQYNTQANNFNINSRLQYRYRPMSDFFLVYTDNYFTDPLFKNKNRALIFKFSYWFNL